MEYGLPDAGSFNVFVCLLCVCEKKYFSELMNLKSSLADAKLGTKDQFLFDVTQLGMCCEACRKTKAACRHKLSMNPYVIAHPLRALPKQRTGSDAMCVCHLRVYSHWKPPERVAKVDAMYVSNETTARCV